MTKQRDLYQKLRDLNTCDPECEGRCTECPQNVANNAADEILLLSRVIYRYISTGWPRYTENEVPREWTPDMQEAQNRAVALVQRLHANSFKKNQHAKNAAARA